MKFLLTAAFLLSTQLFAQPFLQFDKRFVECEDKWVAFQQSEDSSYSFGFIYIDAQAGLTFNYEGTFRVSPDGKFIPLRIDKANVKYRLQANQVKVALVPASTFNDLGITDPPDWLKSYKTDTGSVKRLYRWGFLYNSWDLCEKALTYLERAYKMEPKFKGLEVEMAFSYNALEQYDKALKLLESALETSKDDWYLYKELSYTQMKLGMLEKAEESSTKGIAVCNDSTMKAEMAYNIAYQYYSKKDKEKFSYWAAETRKWAIPGDRYSSALNKLEAAFEE